MNRERGSLEDQLGLVHVEMTALQEKCTALEVGGEGEHIIMYSVKMGTVKLTVDQSKEIQPIYPHTYLFEEKKMGFEPTTYCV